MDKITKQQSEEMIDASKAEMGNGQPDRPMIDGRTTAIFPTLRTDDSRSQQSAQDCLDEALMESFPCSDPPCYSHCHA